MKLKIMKKLRSNGAQDALIKPHDDEISGTSRSSSYRTHDAYAKDSATATNSSSGRGGSSHNTQYTRHRSDGTRGSKKSSYDRPQSISEMHLLVDDPNKHSKMTALLNDTSQDALSNGSGLEAYTSVSKHSRHHSDYGTGRHHSSSRPPKSIAEASQPSFVSDLEECTRYGYDGGRNNRVSPRPSPRPPKKILDACHHSEVSALDAGSRSSSNKSCTSSKKSSTSGDDKYSHHASNGTAGRSSASNEKCPHHNALDDAWQEFERKPTRDRQPLSTSMTPVAGMIYLEPVDFNDDDDAEEDEDNSNEDFEDEVKVGSSFHSRSKVSVMDASQYEKATHANSHTSCSPTRSNRMSYISSVQSSTQNRIMEEAQHHPPQKSHTNKTGKCPFRHGTVYAGPYPGYVHGNPKRGICPMGCRPKMTDEITSNETSTQTLLREAKEFIDLYYHERKEDMKDIDGFLGKKERMEMIKKSIEIMGTYEHTADELEHGARVAWRNAPKCSNRKFWQQVRNVSVIQA